MAAGYKAPLFQSHFCVAEELLPVLQDGGASTAGVVSRRTFASTSPRFPADGRGRGRYAQGHNAALNRGELDHLPANWHFRAGEGPPEFVLDRGGPGMKPEALRAARVGIGHPDGYQEAFAVLYADVAEAVVACQRGERSTAWHAISDDR